MQAVILAAGKGTRMRPLTYDIPKPMLPLKGKPIIEHTMSFLPDCVDKIIIVINYLGKHIKDYFKNEYAGRKITYVFQENLNGTGGALHSCKDILRDKFLVVMGDDLYHRDDLERISKEDMAVLAFEVEDPRPFGVFQIDEQGNLVSIIEKPQTAEHNLVNAAAYTLDKRFFDYELVPLSGINKNEFGLPQTLVSVAKDHPVKILRAKAWYPIGKPEDLEKAEGVLGKFLDFDLVE